MDFDPTNIGKLQNDELFKIMKNMGMNVGPITPSTRSVYERKLKNFLASKEKEIASSNGSSGSGSSGSSNGSTHNDSGSNSNANVVSSSGSINKTIQHDQSTNGGGGGPQKNGLESIKLISASSVYNSTNHESNNIERSGKSSRESDLRKSETHVNKPLVVNRNPELQPVVKLQKIKDIASSSTENVIPESRTSLSEPRSIQNENNRPTTTQSSQNQDIFSLRRSEDRNIHKPTSSISETKTYSSINSNDSSASSSSSNSTENLTRNNKKLDLTEFRLLKPLNTTYAEISTDATPTTRHSSLLRDSNLLNRSIPVSNETRTSPPRDKFAERLKTYGLLREDNDYLSSSTLTTPSATLRSRPVVYENASSTTSENLLRENQNANLERLSQMNEPAPVQKPTNSTSTFNLKYLISLAIVTAIVYFLIIHFQHNPENPLEF